MLRYTFDCAQSRQLKLETFKMQTKTLETLLYPFVSNKSCQSTSFCLDPRNLSAPSIHFGHFVTSEILTTMAWLALWVPISWICIRSCFKPATVAVKAVKAVKAVNVKSQDKLCSVQARALPKATPVWRQSTKNSRGIQGCQCSENLRIHESKRLQIQVLFRRIPVRHRISRIFRLPHLVPMLRKCQFHRESLERMKFPPQNCWQRQQECRDFWKGILTRGLRRWKSWSAWDNSRSSSGGGWNSSSRTNSLFSIGTNKTNKAATQNAKNANFAKTGSSFTNSETVALQTSSVPSRRPLPNLPNHWITPQSTIDKTAPESLASIWDMMLDLYLAQMVKVEDANH